MKTVRLTGVLMAVSMMAALTACSSVGSGASEESEVYVEPNIYTRLEAKAFEFRNNPSSMHTDVGVGSIKFNLNSISTYTTLREEEDETSQLEPQDEVNEEESIADSMVDVTNDQSGDEYE